jgi:3-hydroxybutyryl-CoA dehydrogenase
VLASNTSSPVVTAIAAGLKRPERVAGFPFFQPVPLMKVVSYGVEDCLSVCAALARLRPQMGHTPVKGGHASFIVNHAGRATEQKPCAS